jgi:hypothetical protein
MMKLAARDHHIKAADVAKIVEVAKICEAAYVAMEIRGPSERNELENPGYLSSRG